MTVISEDGRFEWDSEKERTNVRKHGLAFGQILPVFDDEHFLEIYDDEHSFFPETRYIGIGTVKSVAVVVVCYTERNRTRIISARLAANFEEGKYYEKF